MESSLHRELKRIYAGEAAQTEVRLGRYIIDAVVDDELIEIQHGPLSAIRDKIQKLVRKHRVRVVKPLIAKKYLCKFDRQAGQLISRRISPKREQFADLFAELVHFTRAFPHRQLTLEVPIIEIEEHRFPGHGRRRWRHDNDYQVDDQYLLEIQQSHTIRSLAELRQMFLPQIAELPLKFTTQDLSQTLGIKRQQAQQMAYVLRECGATRVLGKQQRSWLYAWKKSILRSA
jgi:hypothetical protein